MDRIHLRTYLAMIVCLAAGPLAAVAPVQADPAATAREVLKQSGVTRGVCAVLGAADGRHWPSSAPAA